MSRLIDADALIKDTWFVVIKGENIDDIAEQIIRQCKRIVSEAPTIDIVRCRECIHYGRDSERNTYGCNLHSIGMTPSDFCSYGERRE